MPPRHFRSMLDLSSAELSELLNVALAIKRDGCAPELTGQVLALVFEKPSLRTRVAFEVAMHRLGGRAIYLSQHEVGAGEREPVRDVARVLARMVQGIAARTYSHSTVAEFARWSDVPVVNALSSEEHPCQALADLLSLHERFGSLRGLRLAYIGDGNNVARSLAYACVMSGVDLVVAAPAGYALPPETVERAGGLVGAGTLTQVRDPYEAARNATALYTDVWASMGFEDEAAQRAEDFKGYQVDAALVAAAPPDVLVMHDLPAHRGEEISDEVIESPNSVVFDQAENRMHAQQAVLASILGGVS